MKKLSGIVDFDGQEITVKELTPREVEQVIEEVNASPPSTLDMLMDHNIPALMVARSSGIDKEKLEVIAPSVLEPLFEKVAEVNPKLAAMAKRLKKIIQ